jgi:hypothetical protein
VAVVVVVVSEEQKSRVDLLVAGESKPGRVSVALARPDLTWLSVLGLMAAWL